jgi:hypothetical protein
MGEVMTGTSTVGFGQTWHMHGEGDLAMGLGPIQSEPIAVHLD